MVGCTQIALHEVGRKNLLSALSEARILVYHFFSCYLLDIGRDQLDVQLRLSFSHLSKFL